MNEAKGEKTMKLLIDFETAVTEELKKKDEGKSNEYASARKELMFHYVREAKEALQRIENDIRADKKLEEKDENIIINSLKIIFVMTMQNTKGEEIHV